jgi:hypothetical protein
VAAMNGPCYQSKLRDNRDCKACDPKDLDEIMEFPVDALRSPNLAWRDTLFLHELLHSCVGNHGDRHRRPDARNLAIEFMVACGQGWSVSLRQLPQPDLPPRYRWVIVP